jgi:hypothetical protein
MAPTFKPSAFSQELAGNKTFRRKPAAGGRAGCIRFHSPRSDGSAGRGAGGAGWPGAGPFLVWPGRGFAGGVAGVIDPAALRRRFCGCGEKMVVQLSQSVRSTVRPPCGGFKTEMATDGVPIRTDQVGVCSPHFLIGVRGCRIGG